MATRIRLRRIGKNPKKRPHFRFSVFDETRGRDSRYIEELGFYSPTTGIIEIDKARLAHWLACGAKPTEAVEHLLSKMKKTETRKLKAQP